MMELRVMQALVATLNDQGESAVATAAVKHWPNDGSRPKYRRASANFVFFFADREGPRVPNRH